MDKECIGLFTLKFVFEITYSLVQPTILAFDQLLFIKE